MINRLVFVTIETILAILLRVIDFRFDIIGPNNVILMLLLVVIQFVFFSFVLFIYYLVIIYLI